MKTLLAVAALCLALTLPGRAQNSDSLNIAADQATSMNKLDDLMGRAQKRLSYIMNNLGELSDNNDTNNNFDKFKENAFGQTSRIERKGSGSCRGSGSPLGRRKSRA
ncbi:MAG: hypothetical protein EB056_04165 [Verrucomicrobia bacterium]|nr:hypothetical protein [Verrucomicrobiota bacterium]